MSLSRKHFEDIALICKNLGDGERDWGGKGELIEKDELVYFLSEYFKCQNPLFDPYRFYKDCGYPEEEYD